VEKFNDRKGERTPDAGQKHGIPPGPKFLALLERLQNFIGKPNYAGLYGIGIKEGNGPCLVDLDGNVYLDCLAGASANILGYRIGGIADVYRDAALSMQHTCFPYSPNTHAVDLAEKLCSIVPGDYPKRVMFGLSGSDSNDGAIKAVRKFTGRMSIIHFKDAWHGSTGLSQPASDFGDKNVGIRASIHNQR
jgi:4-aminobutyrate aminotransferase